MGTKNWSEEVKAVDPKTVEKIPVYEFGTGKSKRVFTEEDKRGE